VDICSLIPTDEADICILEEPEHLNWFRVPDPDADAVNFLGWAHKFKHVVGILHTNYAAYVKQYGMGTSLITAPALNALSSLVVRAYCHRVIRLSSTLPSLCNKEVTSNVHGVRHEFLEAPVPSDDSFKGAPVYFIGKLIWAKGFDDVLDLQEKFNEATGNYFSMDVYGSGNDENSIQRGFFGRTNMQKSTATTNKEVALADKKAETFFGKSDSLRTMLRTGDEDETHKTGDAHTARTVNAAEASATNKNDADQTGDVLSDSDQGDNSVLSSTETEDDDEAKSDEEEGSAPLDILGDVSGKMFSTTMETAAATVTIIDSLVSSMFCTKEIKEKKRTHHQQSKSSKNPLHLVPPRSRYKWRRTPLPCRFLGVKDHSHIRDISGHTIFLNMSTTEVLCTTSAEALAMGKFVILPKHRKFNWIL
jgi:hypothetical protein